MWAIPWLLALKISELISDRIKVSPWLLALKISDSKVSPSLLFCINLFIIYLVFVVSYSLP